MQGDPGLPGVGALGPQGSYILDLRRIISLQIDYAESGFSRLRQMQLFCMSVCLSVCTVDENITVSSETLGLA